MPTTQYPKNPNTDTAFVVQDDGTKNRALMIAPQDISTLELPSNPNSTKGYITVSGKKQRVILTADISGGGSGSSLPDQTGHSGEFLTTDGTDASWGAVSQVPSTTGATQGDVLTVDSGGDAAWATAPSGLPDQTGQSGKFLTTDGTDASWSDKPLVNKTTASSSIQITGYSGDTVTNATGSVLVGNNSSSTGDGSVVVGRSAKVTGIAGVAVGSQSQAGYDGTCVGGNAKVTVDRAIQIGARGTNSEAGTCYIALTDSSFITHNYKLLDNDGTVPHGRLTNAVVSNAVTIAVADWNGGTTCTKTVSGLTATSVVWVAPDNASQSDYLTAGVYASNQTADTITFTATTTPTSALTVNVVYC